MKTVLQLEGNPLVRCSCGREVNADMMVMVGETFKCDACRETLRRTGELSSEAFALAHGAPESVVAKAQEQDAVLLARTFEIEARSVAPRNGAK